MLITGSVGFVGANLVLELLKTVCPIHIIGIDNLKEYYDIHLKEWRQQQIENELKSHPDSSFKS